MISVLQQKRPQHRCGMFARLTFEANGSSVAQLLRSACEDIAHIVLLQWDIRRYQVNNGLDFALVS